MANTNSLKDLVRTLFEGAEGFEDEAGKAKLPAESSGGDAEHAHKVSGNPKGVKAEAEKAPFQTKEKSEWPGKPSAESLLEQLEEEIGEMMAEMGMEEEEEGMHEEYEEEGADEVVLELSDEAVMAEAKKARARLRALKEQMEEEMTDEADKSLSLTIDLDGVSGGDVENVNVSLDGEELDVDMEEEPKEKVGLEMGEEKPEEEEEEEESASLAEAHKQVDNTVSTVNEGNEIRKQLAETQLLTARSLYVNKLFVRDDLSGAQKRKIVEYLDSARTIAEAKEIYSRIVRVLNEGKKQNLVNESKQVLAESTASVEPSFDTSRWQVLAGMKKTVK